MTAKIWSVAPLWSEEKEKLNYSPKIILKEQALFDLNWEILEKGVNHVFSHFTLNCTLVFFRIEKKRLNNLIINRKYRFVKKKDLSQLATPSLIKKILQAFKETKLNI